MPNRLRKVLCYLYYFPPSGGPGLLRALKFVKYLPEFGFEPIVVTVQADTFRNPEEYPIDESGLAEVPPGLRVVRVPSREPVRLKRLLVRTKLMRAAQFVLYPLFWERQALWPCSAIRATRRLGLHREADLAYTCSGPYASNHAGIWARTRAGLPWVADHRDPFSQSWALHWPSRLHHRAAEHFEDRVLRTATRFVANTAGQRDDLLARFPSADADRISVITNGYDESDFDVEPRDGDPEKLVLVHAGSFSDRAREPGGPLRRWLHDRLEYRNRDYELATHSPERIFRILAAVRERSPAAFGRLRVDLVGETPTRFREVAERLGVAGAVRFLGYRPHAETVARMRGADGLILTTISSRSGRPVPRVSQKLYEYLRAGPPVLGLTEAGDTKSILDRSGAGLSLSPGATDDAAAMVVRLASRKFDGGPAVSAPDTAWIRRFERRALTAQLAEEFERALGSGLRRACR